MLHNVRINVFFLFPNDAVLGKVCRKSGVHFIRTSGVRSASNASCLAEGRACSGSGRPPAPRPASASAAATTSAAPAHTQPSPSRCLPHSAFTYGISSRIAAPHPPVHASQEYHPIRRNIALTLARLR